MHIYYRLVLNFIIPQVSLLPVQVSLHYFYYRSRGFTTRAVQVSVQFSFIFTMTYLILQVSLLHFLSCSSSCSSSSYVSSCCSSSSSSCYVSSSSISSRCCCCYVSSVTAYHPLESQGRCRVCTPPRARKSLTLLQPLRLSVCTFPRVLTSHISLL
jgi:hypothetical protein